MYARVHLDIALNVSSDETACIRREGTTEHSRSMFKSVQAFTTIHGPNLDMREDEKRKEGREGGREGGRGLMDEFRWKEFRLYSLK